MADSSSFTLGFASRFAVQAARVGTAWLLWDAQPSNGAGGLELQEEPAASA